MVQANKQRLPKNAEIALTSATGSTLVLRPGLSQRFRAVLGAIATPRIWYSATAILAVAGMVALGLGLASPRHAPAPAHDLGLLPTAAERGKQAGDSAAKGAAAKPTLVGALQRSVPRTIDIPAIGVRSTLEMLGLNQNGTIQVPTKYGEAGWYHLGPSPGQLGSAVILGHVDSIYGPAIFFSLGSLKPGDSVYVTLSDGVIARFVVVAVESFLKTSFPTRRVYGLAGKSYLQLITCTGQFDFETHHYLSNLVVYTSLVSAQFKQ